MRRAAWSLPLLVAWLVLCPLVAAGAFDLTCHDSGDGESVDCCQPLEGSRAPSAPPPLAAAAAVA
ncbi:MAG: hypothetical protein ACRD0X_07205, partial [Thermoanaerobaculia bacterium]